MCGTVEISVIRKELRNDISKHIWNLIMEICSTVVISVTTREHHGDVLYTSYQCDNKTKWKVLKTHIESLQGNVWYTCNQCDYKSAWKGILKRHLDSIWPSFSYKALSPKFLATISL